MSNTAVTEVQHDSESFVDVRSCTSKDCFHHAVTYRDATTPQIRSLIALSEHCEQHMEVRAGGGIGACLLYIVMCMLLLRVIVVCLLLETKFVTFFWSTVVTNSSYSICSCFLV